jgi:rhodanese-related sulfurtransferase
MFGWGTKTATTAELQHQLDTGAPVLIDVREPWEFEAGHIPGAVNIPLGTLPDRASTFKPHAETFLICKSGNRSGDAARQLKALGFTQAYSVKGGMNAWRGEVKR